MISFLAFVSNKLSSKLLETWKSKFLPFLNKGQSYKSLKGPSINDVTALGGRGYQGFCDNSTYAFVLKSVTMGGGGVKNYLKQRDVIYGRPLMSFFFFKTKFIL